MEDWSAPLTESQLGLVVVQKSIPVPHLYNILIELSLASTVTTYAVKYALTSLIEVQPALRLAFRDLQALLVSPLSIADLPLREVVVQDAFESTVDAELEALAKTEFQLDQAPLLRATHVVAADGQRSSLLLVIHHAVFDGASIEPLIRDFSSALAGNLDTHTLRHTREAALQRELAAQFRAANEARVEGVARTLGARLQEAPTTVLFPRPGRPLVTSFSGQRRRIELSHELNAGIDRTLSELGVTPFTFFAGIFAATLGRHADVPVVTFGVPLAARRTLASYDLCGFFVNTLPFIAQVPWQIGFDEYLRSTISTEIDQLKRSVAVPFTRVVRYCSPNRDSNRNPLFSSMLAMQDSTAVAPDGPVQSVREHGTGTAKFDLWLGVTPTPDGWLLELEHDTTLLPQQVADGIHGSILDALNAVVRDPGVALADLFADSSLDDSVRDDGYWHEPAASDLYTWLQTSAVRYADRVAVEEGGSVLTYRDLYQRVDKAAAGLYERNVRDGDVIGLTTVTLIDTIIAMLAVLKLRAVFLPLDLSLPAERLSYMTDKAHCRIAVGVGDPGITVFELGALQGALNPPTGARRPEDGVYVMFTSGSTGKPKGVLMHNAPLVNLTAWQLDALSIDEHSRFLQYAPLGFDVSFQEIVPTLVAGGAVVSRGGIDRRDFPGIAHHVRQGGLTHVYLPVAALRSFVQAAADFDLPALRYLCVSGEQLIVDENTQAFFERHPDVQLVNLYGPTETHAVTTHRLAATDIPWPAYVPIGLPLTGVTAQVIDRTGHMAPRGVVGELLLGGRCPASGYINDLERTVERFIDDPYVPGATRYRTGDQVLRDEKGQLVFLGRNDHQIKIRGFRVEPGEIEGALLKHPAVTEATVLAVGEGQSRRLIAYVVAEPGDQLAAELFAHLIARVPDYMVPSAFVRLDALPLTGNGKVDQKLLPAPEDDAFVRQVYAAPEGEIECRLAAIWSELLGLERISRHDNFFELGGHSLLGMQLVSRVADLGAELPLASLFTSPTLVGLAEEVLQHQVQGGASLLPIEPLVRNGLLPLSFAQQRLWLLAQFDGGSDAYHIPMAWYFKGSLNVEALRQALNTLFERHEVLRSVFVTRDGQPWVNLLPPEHGLPLIEQDLRHVSDPQAELDNLSATEARLSFNLAQGPLVRARLIRLSDEACVFLLTQHHIVSDGWSFGVLLPELRTLYAAILERRPHGLAPLTIQYADYAAWQRQWLSNERLQVQGDYWRTALAGMPTMLDLPTDRPRPAQQSFVGAQVPIHFDRTFTQALGTLSSKHGVTLFMTVLAAWAAVLSRLSGQDDLVIGTPTANRRHQDVESLIGFFVNMLTLRVDLSGAPDTGELLKRVRDRVLGAQGHQDLPFEQVVEIAQPPRRSDHTPLFQVIFVWENTDVSQWSLPGLEVSPAKQAYDTVKFDLELSLALVDGEIVGTLDYSTALFDRETIERHAGYLQSILQAMVLDTPRAVATVDILAPAERELLLDTWNQHTIEYPENVCVHRLFEQQVERRPHAVALIYEGQQTSYAELNARANRLAHQLISLGVKPDTRVAICMKRSPALLVGLLAVLKAGGAYVPLDPDYPSERLVDILQDCSPVALLTDSAGRDVLGETALTTNSVLDPNVLPDLPETNVRVPGLTSRHLAYVIYTSGSTGKPKGVMVEHRNLISQAAALQHRYDVTEQDRLLLFASISFDMSVEDIFVALTCGASLVLRTDQWLNSEYDFAALCAVNKVTYLNIPSAFFIRLAIAQPEIDLPATLRQIVFGGEASYPPALQAWFNRKGHRPALFNAYGPTETTVNATLLKVLPDNVMHSIGRPIANTRTYVLTADGQPAPLGAAGELYIGGACVARGYLNRQELTAQVFVDDPFSAVPGARMYKTGDLARYLPDASLVFLGRNDHQVKIRGFRIELGEIEARLAEHPQVLETSVIAVGDGVDRRLVAYVVAEPAESLAGTLRAHLATRLPEYMVPAAFVRLNALPLTPNGKIDRKALPVPDDDAFARQVYEAPQGEVEVALAGVWAQLLKLDKVSRHDNFFALGGHSLLAVQMISQLAGLGYSLSLNELFQYSVLSHLAPQIARGSIPGARSGSVVVRAEGNEPAIFFVPSGLGDYSYSFSLAPHIAANHPIYALPWPSAAQAELQTIESMATTMAAFMQAIQPTGPYRVIGYSAGGVLAYAIAAVLSDLGHEVDFLGIIDGAPPSLDATGQPVQNTFFEDIAARSTLAQREAVECLQQQVATVGFTQLIEAAQELGLYPRGLDPNLERVRWEQVRGFERNVDKYLIGVPPVKIHLFRAQELSPYATSTIEQGRTHSTLGWGQVVDHSLLECIATPGDHYSMLEDAYNRKNLGGLINKSLAGLQVT